MKNKLLAALLLATCGVSFAATQNNIRLPASGMRTAVVEPGGGVGSSPGDVVLPSTGATDPARPDVPAVNAPKLELASTLDFGPVLLYQSMLQTVFLKNSGTAPLTLSYIEKPYDSFSAYRNGPESCEMGKVLQPAETCSFAIHFTPNFEGPATDNLSVESDGGTGHLALKGHGQGHPRAMDVVQAPTGVLGIYPTGTTSGMGAYQFSFKNNGSIPLTPTSVLTRGASTGGSTATLSSNTCNVTVQPAGTCSFTLTPTSAQPAVVTLAFAETPNVTTVNYTIVAESPRLNHLDSRVVGNVIYARYANPNKLVPVVIKHMSLQALNTYEDISASFKVTGCVNTTLAPGASCEVAVEYLPASGPLAGVSPMLMMQTQTTGTSLTGLTWSSGKWWP